MSRWDVATGYADQIQAKIYCKAGRADCGNDFSNMLQASPLIIYKYMLNVNIRVDLSEKYKGGFIDEKLSMISLLLFTLVTFRENYCSLVTFR